MHIFTDYILLGISVVFNYFISGYVLTELFVSKLKIIFKTPLYFVLSILATTNLVYLTALVFGLSSNLIYINYLFWLCCFIYVLYLKRFKFYLFYRNHWQIYLLSLIVFLVFVVSLYKSIFYFYNGYYVMSADNWQDTALHFSIMENIKEGNFPPIAPYYSGHKLDYHYFTDLHSAIITFPLNKFTPRIFILDNSIMAAIFAFSIYSLTYYLTKLKSSSILASILAVFSGSLLSFKFFNDLILGGNLKEMLSTSAYVLEYGKLFQMAPMTNYFLQNRPMMVGMPVLVSSLFLLFNSLDKKGYSHLFLVFVISILTFKFQMIISLIVFALLLIFVVLKIKSNKLFYNNFNLKKLFYLLPFSIATLFLKDNINLFLSNFDLGPWVNDKSLFWFFNFFIANLGVPFFLLLILTLLIVFKKISPDWKVYFLFIFFLVLVSVPLIFTFTIDRADMLKFIYIAYIPMSILVSIVLSRIYKKTFGKIMVVILLILSTSTGLIDLAGSYLNKNFGYSVEDLEVGQWIRNNTPANSVFVTSPSVHSPVSDIAGRIRVLSYTNWPYTHGYGDKNDNVFVRFDDIEKFYKNIDSSSNIVDFVSKYNINYIYYGQNESSNFPEAKNGLESNNQVRKVYENNDIKIFKIK